MVPFVPLIQQDQHQQVLDGGNSLTKVLTKAVVRDRKLPGHSLLVWRNSHFVVKVLNPLLQLCYYQAIRGFVQW